MRPFRFDRGDPAPILFAHRGASDRALENSLAALSLALSDGADAVEFDVRLSSDGEPFVLHDARTGRTARENLRVASTSASRLRHVRLKNGEPLPSLRDALDRLRGEVPVNIEVKVPGGMEAVRRALEAVGYAGEVLLSSGLRDECLGARALLPELPCGLVTGRPSGSDIAFCLRHALPSIHPDHRTLSVLRTRKVEAAGLRLLPYTVDDEETLFRLADAGAAGVFSNRADVLRAAWRERALGRR